MDSDTSTLRVKQDESFLSPAYRHSGLSGVGNDAIGPPPLTRSKTQWESLIGDKLPRDRFHTDYVLVYRRQRKGKGLEEGEGEDIRRDLEGGSVGSEMRERFARLMQDEGMEIIPEKHGNYIYLKIHVPFWRLCHEAERSHLELPVKGFETYPDNHIFACWEKFEDAYLKTDNEIDFASSPLIASKLYLYENGDDPDKFFRPAVRSFLTHLILIHLNLSKNDDFDTRMKKHAADRHQGLLYMLHQGYYSDAFIVHDPTKHDQNLLSHILKMKALHGSSVDINVPDERELVAEGEDTRRIVDSAWCTIYKYQPLWKIRNYFGEKIALYFAWCGVLMQTLWIPMLFGLAVFIYGLHRRAISIVGDMIEIVKESFDNNVTAYYALFISIWGSVFLQVWTRANYHLAYEWDVDSFESAETDRPEFVGTVEIPDPVIIGEKAMHSPFYRQCIKFGVSISVLVLMICIVFIATAAIILYRIVITLDYCWSMNPNLCFFASNICSSIINAIVILALGKLYDWLAVKLTDWENHRTETQYNDALVLKLFAFQFANSYTSLFYIAFFRGKAFQNGLFGLGEKYIDTCGEKGESTCMTMLSFQVLILMITKPIPKFINDIVIPGLVYFWRKKLKSILKKICCCCCRRANKIHGDTNVKLEAPSFLEREHQKEDLKNFTLSEYTEKIILYGFLMLFAASFPLAPLVLFFILLIDVRVDAKRMLWMYRRPVAYIAQDVGIWYEIIQFLNIAAVVSNSFIIGFTSEWGNDYDLKGQLIIIIVFEHIAFAVKLLLEACIPDVPSWVKLSIKREKYQVRLIFDRDLEGSARNGHGRMRHRGESRQHDLRRRRGHSFDDRSRYDGRVLDDDDGKELGRYRVSPEGRSDERFGSGGSLRVVDDLRPLTKSRKQGKNNEGYTSDGSLLY